MQNTQSVSLSIPSIAGKKRQKSSLSRLAGCVILLLAFVIGGCEDYRGTVTGSVIAILPDESEALDYDRNGDFVFIEGRMAGVQVVISSLADSEIRKGFTDCNGVYTIYDVRYGPNVVRSVVDNCLNYTEVCDSPVPVYREFQDTRNYFIDVREDETHRLNIETTRIWRTRNIGLVIEVERMPALSTRATAEDLNITFGYLDDPPLQHNNPIRIDLYRSNRVIEGTSLLRTLYTDIYDRAKFFEKEPVENSFSLTESVQENFRVELTAEGYEATVYEFSLDFNADDTHIETVPIRELP